MRTLDVSVCLIPALQIVCGMWGTHTMYSAFLRVVVMMMMMCCSSSRPFQQHPKTQALAPKGPGLGYTASEPPHTKADIA